MKLTRKNLKRLIESVLNEEQVEMKDVLNSEAIDGGKIEVEMKPKHFKVKPGKTSFEFVLKQKFKKLMFSSKNNFIIQAQPSKSVQGAERVTIPVMAEDDTLKYDILSKEKIDIDIVVQPVM